MLLAFLVYVVSNLAYNGTFFALVGTWIILAFIFVKVFKLCYNLYNLDGPRFRVKVGVSYKLKGKDEYLTVTDVFKYSRCIYVGMDKYAYDYFVNMVEPPIISDHPIDKLQMSKKWLYLGIFSLVLHTLLPNRDTMIYCVSAYMLQTVITDERTQELGSAAYDATLSQLQEWSKENKDVEKLIQPIIKGTLKNETN